MEDSAYERERSTRVGVKAALVEVVRAEMVSWVCSDTSRAK